jgi:hypothetical protein
MAKRKSNRGKGYTIRLRESGKLQIEIAKYEFRETLPKGTLLVDAHKHAQKNLVDLSNKRIPELGACPRIRKSPGLGKWNSHLWSL